ncbi:MAG TPA: allantoinase AllB [Bacteroidota bacterium]
MQPDFAIVSRRVVTPDGTREAALLVAGETIVGVARRSEIPSSMTVEDVGDLVVMPGLIDSHVHINEPGRTEWEGFVTATRAAAAGGITTLVDMPLNSSPVTTSVAAFDEKLRAADGKLHVDCGFYGGAVPGNTDDLQPMAEAGVLGFKAFLVHSGIDDFPDATEGDLRAAMPLISKTGLPLLVHCELASGAPQWDGPPTSYRAFLASRPRKWEQDAIELMIRLCRATRCRIHIVHLSSADALPTLSAARIEGLPLTVETCPHYLYFSAEDVTDSDTRFKCTPPIRERENRERLWEALLDGTIDFVVSDHSPSAPELKLLNEGDFQKAWGGIASLQFGLSIVWTEAGRRGATLADMARWMSGSPAQLAGLSGRKGRLDKGYDADMVVWSPEESFEVTAGKIFHRHPLTPYEGRQLTGRVHRTYLRGRKIYDSGDHITAPYGQAIFGLNSAGGSARKSRNQKKETHGT